MIYSNFPDHVTVGEEKLCIDPDFRIFCGFETAQNNDDNAATARYIAAFYRGKAPSDIKAAIHEFLKFYLCGSEIKGGSSENKHKKPVYSFEQDWKLFIAACRQQYGIDLCTAKLHWWEFSALFAGLTDDTQLITIMQIRGTDTSKIKDKHERSRIKSLQERFALSDRGRKRRYATAEERDAAMLEEVRTRSEQVRKQFEERNRGEKNCRLTEE